MVKLASTDVPTRAQAMAEGEEMFIRPYLDRTRVDHYLLGTLGGTAVGTGLGGLISYLNTDSDDPELKKKLLSGLLTGGGLGAAVGAGGTLAYRHNAAQNTRHDISKILDAAQALGVVRP